MKQEAIHSPTLGTILVMGVFILLATWGFFIWTMKHNKSVIFFIPGNLIALIFYFIPTFTICYLLLLLFWKRSPSKKSLIWALLVGIPVGFSLVIFDFLWLNAA